jgi:hypothetical protein
MPTNNKSDGKQMASEVINKPRLLVIILTRYIPNGYFSLTANFLIKVTDVHEQQYHFFDSAVSPTFWLLIICCQ